MCSVHVSMWQSEQMVKAANKCSIVKILLSCVISIQCSNKKREVKSSSYLTNQTTKKDEERFKSFEYQHAKKNKNKKFNN